MKHFVLLTAIFLASCTSQQGDQLTQQQKEQIRSEGKALLDSLLAKDQKLDMDGALQYYLDSPDFIAINPDGSRLDFHGWKKSFEEAASTSSSLKIQSTREDFIVLSRDLVLCSFIGKAELSLKSGDRMVFDPDAVTMMFQKIGGKWRITYSHESATITAQKPVKK